MNDALATVGARIDAALDYLAHEPDPIRAIPLAEKQLRHAREGIRVAQGHPLERRADDPQPLTFLRAVNVAPSDWPPIETNERDVKSFTEVFGRSAA